MSRKSKNITMQLHDELNKKLCIGQKKIKDGEGRVEGIHSVQTAETYRRTIKLFGEHLKSEGVKNIKNITSENINSFFDGRRDDKSAYTLKRELAAINKVLNSRFSSRDFALPDRSRASITNNRGYASHRPINASNRPKIDFVSACGCRRSSIATVKVSDCIKDNDGLVIGVHLTEKGGRERYAVVLESYRDSITEMVNNRYESLGGNDGVLFDSPLDKNINPHWYRSEYAVNLYNDLDNCEGDYYNGCRGMFVDDDALKRAIERYGRPSGYDAECVGEVSQALGHNRLEVALVHYLNKK